MEDRWRSLRARPAATQVANIPRATDATWLERLLPVVGLGVMILIAMAVSDDRKAIAWRLVWMGCCSRASSPCSC